MTTSDRVSIDFAWSMTPDEALELLAHHLKLACALFEVCPEGPEARKELARLFSQYDAPVTYIPIPKSLALNFWDVATSHYDQLGEVEDDLSSSP